MLRALERQGVISPRIDLYLGHCHLDEDRPGRRCGATGAASPSAPREASAWVGIALCHGRLGRLDRALEALRHAATLDPEREEIHCHLVHCYALPGDVPRRRPTPASPAAGPGVSRTSTATWPWPT